MFVVRIDADTFDVVLGSRAELAQTQLRTGGANWLIEPPRETFRGLVQIRYNSSAVPARIEPLDDHCFAVELDEPAQGVAPGQLCVVYQGEGVLGGGWIE